MCVCFLKTLLQYMCEEVTGKAWEEWRKNVHIKLQDCQRTRNGEINEVPAAQELNAWIKMKCFSTFYSMVVVNSILHVLHFNNDFNTQAKKTFSTTLTL